MLEDKETAAIVAEFIDRGFRLLERRVGADTGMVSSRPIHTAIGAV